jgi:hypothetical protein
MDYLNGLFQLKFLHIAQPYLYRAINQKEYEAGFRLYVNSAAKTKIDPVLFEATPAGLIAAVGGLRHHQRGGLFKENPTNGISTTKKIEVAIEYAMRRPTDCRYVVRIARKMLRRHLIREYPAYLAGPYQEKPSEKEVILVHDFSPDFLPSGIIDRIYNVIPKGCLIDLGSRDDALLKCKRTRTEGPSAD